MALALGAPIFHAVADHSSGIYAWVYLTRQVEGTSQTFDQAAWTQVDFAATERFGADGSVDAALSPAVGTTGPGSAYHLSITECATTCTASYHTGTYPPGASSLSASGHWRVSFISECGLIDLTVAPRGGAGHDGSGQAEPYGLGAAVSEDHRVAQAGGFHGVACGQQVGNGGWAQGAHWVGVSSGAGADATNS